MKIYYKTGKYNKKRQTMDEKRIKNLDHKDRLTDITKCLNINEKGERTVNKTVDELRNK